MKKIRKVCARGHTFYKSSDCPMCPQCWSGYYRKKVQHDLPSTISAPALRALLGARINSLVNLAKYTEKEILTLHGVGPSSIPKLKRALQSKQLSFRKTSGKLIK